MSIPSTFDIACECGTRLRGARQARHQVVPCPACGSPRFVLPLSPLPDPAAPAKEPGAAKAAKPSRRRTWAIVGVGVVLLLGVAGLAFILLGSSGRSARTEEEAPSEERLQRHVADGRSALAEGAYLRATREFESAVAMRDRLGGPTAERRQLSQLHRQSSLLADLLAESPAEILRHFVGMPEAEWREAFRQRYTGRSLLLDDTISRTPAGVYRHGFRIAVSGGEARIDLGQLRLLRDVPLPQPQRLILGLRLAELRREPNGWALLPGPDSGVLLTDPEMFAGLSLPADAELREVLKRQAAWLESSR